MGHLRHRGDAVRPADARRAAGPERPLHAAGAPSSTAPSRSASSDPSSTTFTPPMTPTPSSPRSPTRPPRSSPSPSPRADTTSIASPASSIRATPRSSPRSSSADPPSSVFGLVTAALQRRRDAGQEPFTISSCDNIQGNGDISRGAFVGYARMRDRSLADWIRSARGVPELDGRPDHPGHHPRRHRPPQRGLRHYRRLAGGMRAVRAVGASRTTSRPGDRRTSRPGFRWSATWSRTS